MLRHCACISDTVVADRIEQKLTLTTDPHLPPCLNCQVAACQPAAMTGSQPRVSVDFAAGRDPAAEAATGRFIEFCLGDAVLGRTRSLLGCADGERVALHQMQAFIHPVGLPEDPEVGSTTVYTSPRHPAPPLWTYGFSGMFHRDCL